MPDLPSPLSPPWLSKTTRRGWPGRSDDFAVVDYGASKIVTPRGKTFKKAWSTCSSTTDEISSSSPDGATGSPPSLTSPPRRSRSPRLDLALKLSVPPPLDHCLPTSMPHDPLDVAKGSDVFHDDIPSVQVPRFHVSLPRTEMQAIAADFLPEADLGRDVSTDAAGASKPETQSTQRMSLSRSSFLAPEVGRDVMPNFEHEMMVQAMEQAALT